MNKKLIIGLVAGLGSAVVATVLGIVGHKHIKNNQVIDQAATDIIE